MLFAGAVANQEWTDSGGDALLEDDSQQSLEGALGATWRIFRFGDPDLSLASSAYLYPSLTESGRPAATSTSA